MARIDFDTFRKLVNPLHSEGGYSNLSHDYETLFGITRPNWVKHIETLDLTALKDCPPEILSHFTRIQQAGSSAQKLHETSAFLQEIGRYLKPMDAKASQPNHGQPLRSKENLRTGLTAEQQHGAVTVAHLATQLLYEEYAVKPHFAEYPPALGIQTMDSSINLGQPRTAWAIWETLHNANIISNATYKQLPKLDAHQAAHKDAFSTGSPGAAYASADTLKHLATIIAQATPEQINQAADKFNAQRLEYYDVLSKTPGLENKKIGWELRSWEIYGKAKLHAVIDTPLQELRQAAAIILPTVENKQAADKNQATAKEYLEAAMIDSQRLHRKQPVDLLPTQFYRNPIQGNHIAIEIPGKGIIDVKLEGILVREATGSPFTIAEVSKLKGVTYTPAHDETSGVINNRIEASLSWQAADGKTHHVTLDSALLKSINFKSEEKRDGSQRAASYWLETTTDAQGKKHLAPENSDTVLNASGRTTVYNGVYNIQDILPAHPIAAPKTPAAKDAGLITMTPTPSR